MRSIKSETAGVASIQPELHNADVAGASAELVGYDAALVLIQTGDYTDGTFPIQVEESDDAATWTAVADADLDGTEPVIDAAADADSVFRVGYLGSKRYLRVAIVGSTAGATGAEIAASILRAKPKYAPVA